MGDSLIASHVLFLRGTEVTLNLSATSLKSPNEHSDALSDVLNLSLIMHFTGWALRRVS